MKSRNVLWLIVAIVIVVAAVWWAVAANNDDSQSGDRTRMTVGHVNLGNDLPAYVAKEKGYFEAEGLDVTLRKMDSSKLATDALYAGSIDASAGSSTVPLLGAESTQPGRAKVYALGYTGKEEDTTLGGFVVPQDSAIRDIEDFAGKKIAVFPGGTAKVLLARYLERHDVDTSKIQWIEQLPNLWVASLQNGSVDSVYAYEPQYTLFKQDKKEPVRVVAFGALEAEIDPLYLGGSTISTKFIEQNREAAKSYIKAYYRGIDFIENNETEARQILAKYTGVSENVTREMNLYPDAKLSEIDRQKFQQLADILYEEKNINAKVDTSKMYVDESLTR